MNTTNFIELIQDTASIDAAKTAELEAIINEYPYFQLARAIQLKGLNNTNSFKYNQALKKTAAYTVDRSVLFNFITSQNFAKDAITTPPILEEIEIIEPETIEVLPKKAIEPAEEKNEEIPKKTVESTEIESLQNTTLETLEIGKPLKFKDTEPHSFNEWMQLVAKKPIIRTETTEKSTPKSNKINLINKFIESKPKIKPISKTTVNQDLSPKSITENESSYSKSIRSSSKN